MNDNWTLTLTRRTRNRDRAGRWASTRSHPNNYHRWPRRRETEPTTVTRERNMPDSST